MNRANQLLLLLTAETVYRPASFFAKKMAVSTKTVYKYLEEIRPRVEETGLSLSSVPRHGIMIEGSESEKRVLATILKSDVKEKNGSDYSLKYRRLYLFAELMFSEKVKSYEFYSEYFYVSQQSIKKDFDSIISFLRQNDVETKRGREGLEFLAKELVLQNTFKKYLENYEEGIEISREQKEELFGKEILLVVDSFLSRISTLSFRPPNNYLNNSLERSLIISLRRIKNGKHIPEDVSLLFDKLGVMQLYMTVMDLSHEINDVLNIAVEESDIYYYCSLLFAHGIGPIIKMSSEKSKAQHEVRELIKDISEAIDCDLTYDTYLEQSLLSHVIPMIYRLRMGVEIKNPLKREIITQYSTMVTLVSYSVRKLEKAFAIQLTEDEISFISIYVQLAFEKVHSVYHILIVCPIGMGTSQLVYQRVQQNLNSKNNILEIANVEELEEMDLSNVDLLISTVGLPELSVPKVYVSALPTNGEIDEINRVLLNMESNEKKFINHHSDLTLLRRRFNPDFIFIRNTSKTMEEVVNFFSDVFEKAGKVSPAFRPSIFDRELIGTTGLSTGVAIPHADPSSVEETTIGLMTLEQSVLWGGNNIRLIMMLAVATKDVNKIRSVISQLYDLLTSSEVVEKIVNCQDKEEILKIITEN